MTSIQLIYQADRVQTAMRTISRHLGSLRRSVQREIAPRGVDLSVGLTHDIVAGEAPGEFLSVGLEPWCELVPNGPLPRGWCTIACLLDQDVPTQAMLHADDGCGFRAGGQICLPPAIHGRISALVRLPDQVVGLRLLPLQSTGRFRLGKVRIRERSKVGATFAALAEASGRRRVSSGALLLSWARDGGLQGLKKHLRAEVEVRPQPIGYGQWLHRDEWQNAEDTLRSRERAETENSTRVLVALTPQPTGTEQVTISSLAAQTFPHWSMVTLRPDTHPGVTLAQELAAHPDASIVMFLTAGDTLSPEGLEAVVDAFSRVPAPQVVYTDDDRPSPSGRVPAFKPCFSPYRLVAQDYIGGRFAVSRPWLEAHLSRLSSSAWTYELLLHAISDRALVHHLPHPLVHCCSPAGVDDGEHQQAREKWLARQWPGVRAIPSPDGARLSFPLSKPLLTSIIVPTRDQPALLRACVASVLARTTETPSEIIIVDNGSEHPDTLALLSELQQTPRVRVIRQPGPFNFSAINNAAAAHARGDVLVFLNDDTVAQEDGWLEELVSLAVRSDVGAVGCRLLYGDESIQHAGVVLGMGGVAGHPYACTSASTSGHLAELKVTREVGAVTAACLAMRRTVFEEVNGFDAAWAVAFNDVDLCLRLRERGYSVLWTPFSTLLHFESQSRGSDAAFEKTARLADEAARLKLRHGRSVLDDPYYNPNRELLPPGGVLARDRRNARRWRKSSSGPTVAILTQRLCRGYGVDLVVAEHAEGLWALGCTVRILVLEYEARAVARFAPLNRTGRLEVVRLATADDAAFYLDAHPVDVAIAHTPTMYEALWLADPRTRRVLFDHGEPPASWFPNKQEREATRLRKIALARQVDRSIAVSRFIQEESGLGATAVCFNGYDHRLRRRSDLGQLEGRLRAKLHIDQSRFVVLTVTRFFAEDRFYKGIDVLANIADAMRTRHPAAAQKTVFVLAGRCEPEGSRWARGRGFLVLENPDDEELAAAFLDADAYVSMSQWEGCNLGLAEALSFGLPSMASARGAHAEFGIPVSNDPGALAARLAELAAEKRHARGGSSVERLAAAPVRSWKKAVRELTEQLDLGIPCRSPSLDEPRLSFLVANTGERPALEACIESIERSCKIAHEVLIGDMGAADPAVLEFYARTPCDVHHLGVREVGLALNVLAKRARAPVFAFLSSDVRFLECDFSAVLAALEQCANTGAIRGCCPLPRTVAGDPFGGPHSYGPGRVACPTMPPLVLRRALFEQAGGFRTHLSDTQFVADLVDRLRKEGLCEKTHPGLQFGGHAE